MGAACVEGCCVAGGLGPWALSREWSQWTLKPHVVNDSFHFTCGFQALLKPPRLPYLRTIVELCKVEAPMVSMCLISCNLRL